MNGVPDWVIYLATALGGAVGTAFAAAGAWRRKNGGGTAVTTGPTAEVEVVGGALADRHSIMALAASIEAQAAAINDQTVEMAKAVTSIRNSSVSIETLSMRLLELTKSIEDLKREIYELGRKG